MAIGERIRFFRNLQGITQKQLGIFVGFSESTADVRMAQYESGSRGPKADLIKKLANIFDVSEKALEIPDIDSYIGVMHTLFAMEDLYGLKIDKLDDEICIRPMMQLSLTYDHRILDGAPAAQFLRRVKQLLETPGLLI